MVLHQVASEGRKMSWVGRRWGGISAIVRSRTPITRLLDNFRSRLPVWVAVQQPMSRTPNRMPG